MLVCDGLGQADINCDVRMVKRVTSGLLSAGILFLFWVTLFFANDLVVLWPSRLLGSGKTQFVLDDLHFFGELLGLRFMLWRFCVAEQLIEGIFDAVDVGEFAVIDHLVCPSGRSGLTRDTRAA